MTPMMRPLLIAVLALVLPASASAANYKILHKQHTYVRRIGPLEVYAGHGTVAAAKAAFGQPTSLTNQDSTHCQGVWSVGLTLNFQNAHSHSNVCAAAKTIVTSFSATGTAFVTHKGLRPGMTQAQLMQKYPNATSPGAGVFTVESGTVTGVHVPIITAFLQNLTGVPSNPDTVQALTGAAQEVFTL
jgi:hypothetical protein